MCLIISADEMVGDRRDLATLAGLSVYLGFLSFLPLLRPFLQLYLDWELALWPAEIYCFFRCLA